MENNMQIVMEIIVSFFLIVGACRRINKSGNLTIPMPPTKVKNAPTKSSTLGLGSFLIAGMIYAAFNSRLGFAELLITLLAFITAPVSANLIAQAAIHLRLRSTSGDVPEAINRPLPWQRQKIIKQFKDKI